MTSQEAIAQLEKILTLRDAATPGKWSCTEVDEQRPDGYVLCADQEDSMGADTEFIADVIFNDNGAANAAFIASAHTLASIAEHLRDEVSSLTRTLAKSCDEGRDESEGWSCSRAAATEGRERKLAEERSALHSALMNLLGAENVHDLHAIKVGLLAGQGLPEDERKRMVDAVNAAIQADTGAKP